MSGPSFCWQCGKPLQPPVCPRFEVVVDQLGNPHCVHLGCRKSAENECRYVTAQPPVRKGEAS